MGTFGSVPLALCFVVMVACERTTNPPRAPQPAAPPAPSTPPDPAESEPIGRLLGARAQRYVGTYVPDSRIFRAILNQGDLRDFPAVLDVGRCYKIVGVGSDSVTDLDLLLIQPDGTLVERDTALDATPVLGMTTSICPTAPGAYRIQARMAAGTGEVAVRVYRSN